ncbi:YtxH domain-containing protein [Candidatus Peregrinibacteria bacterium]|nr:YtxH domain-containing protein [Candidatus Peregrinibacteria bacterium]
MFFKKKKQKKEKLKKKLGTVDKLVTGMIVGAAVGSVLGVGFAPKKGKDTRKDIADGAKKVYGKINHKSEIKPKFTKHEIPEEM